MSAAARGGGDTVLIKKYGNRRLYDTSQSRYITLDDLSEIVKAGTSVRVIEASSERDLTRQVLTQVILERQESLDIVPVELLQAIIRVRGTFEQAPFAAFLAAMTRQFAQSGQLWTQQLSTFFGVAQRAGAGETTAPPTEATDDEDVETTPDLDDLRLRMDKLLGKLAKE